MGKLAKTGLIAVVLAALAAGAWYFAGDRLLALAGGGGGEGGQARGSRAVPVEIGEVQRGAVLVTAETTGELEARESTEVTMDARGLVREVAFDEGERVAEGQLLVQLDDEEEQAQVDQAIAERAQVELELGRARELAEQDFESEARVDQLETRLERARAQVEIARAQLNERTLEAPFDGWIGLRLVSPGTLIEPGTVVAWLWSTGPMELAFEVPAALGPRLERGQNVIARSDALPGGWIEGEVEVIEFAVAEKTRTISLEAAFDNADGQLRPGTFLEIELVLDQHDDALLVPEEALLLRGSDAYVYVVGEDQTVARRQVTVGERRRGEAEITEGLEGGETIVVAGLQTIAEGQKVRPVSSSDGRDGKGSGKDAPDGQGGSS
jgi:membrane fusion protein (multidrug efflux system)